MAYYTERELIRIVNSFVNAQDSALVLAIYSGILGNNYSELINIKHSDIDAGTMQVSVKGADGEARLVPINDETLDELLGAAKQDEYFTRNGDIGEDGRRSTSLLISSEFVFRPTVDEGVMAQDTIDRRLSALQGALGLDDFSASMIFRSGILHRNK